MQNPYYKSGHRSGLDSTVNSEFDDNLDKYRELKTESFLGYLNRGNPEGSGSPVPSLPGLSERILHPEANYSATAYYTRETSEALNQPISTPNPSHYHPQHSANGFHRDPLSDEYRRASPATPFADTPTRDTRALTPLIIDPPTAISRHSHYTVGSGLGDSSETEGLRYSGMSFGDQPLRSRLRTSPFSSNQVNRNVKPSRRKRAIFIVCIVIVVCTCAIIGLVIGLITKNKGMNNDTDGVARLPRGDKLWGVGGDTITTDKGNKFLYNNTLGGTWVGIPYNDTARPQGNQPALNERWDYSVNKIIGVNLGGWLVIEPFIAPGLFDPYVQEQNPPSDEWELSLRLGNSMAKTIEAHYDSFIVEEDFAQIASAGLNWVRIPVGWWMIETMGSEPFLAGVSWKYFFRAIVWARKYGLRINLDLHAVPGSQNSWNHSGRLGTTGFLSGAMGIANAQRTLNYIRTLTQFISQPEFKRVIPMFSILNEPDVTLMSSKALVSWYYESYKLIREIGGIGEGNGPFIVIHDAFQGIGAGGPAKNRWSGFLQGSDRTGLDSHTYFAFTAQLSDVNATRPCNAWAARSNQTMEGFGLSMSGEWSLALNDCGLYVNNVGWGQRYEGTWPNATRPDRRFPKVGSCDQWLDHRKWSDAQKKGFADTASASQDALINSFFWTWKIGNSLRQDFPPNPMWNYKLGLEAGYIRPDARTSTGRCAALASEYQVPLTTYEWSGTLASWQTGGAGAGNISQSQIDAVGPFPPATILGGAPNGQGSYNTQSLPQLAPTGSPLILKPIPIVMDSKTYSGGDGWFNNADKAGFFAPINGCTYLDPWSGVDAPAPAACNSSSTQSKQQSTANTSPSPLRT
ncbi:hypothetical protein MJO29_001403 [Puccinia striiformis f. sp. tritici]|uniref:hypothetical protein n=1 Tax=Puccinia striiformis f. sp. tritici TaxID=168172 RepID=UPI002008DF07|nr:hypothetical protein Pst134EA_003361 [Puccinia striiformis f. sp. tritici]KAH9464928.1 hypothetical protein Pst134EB_004427 [Puccinia striiformis f. sp. tritici]KAH9472756.1 hypothetical protein Pst134EA_003361 [Puccinia striiformis f. sp. tritici]KAI7965655.1 hypothetical protein MJO29_001403 [Puccinia striiformis f. sp. tritici]